MNFLQLAQKRCSVRQYLDKPVERARIERCLEAARLAPSACNGQPWRFIVVDDPSLRHEVAEAALGPGGSFNRFVRTAPVLVVVVREGSNASARIGGFLKGMDYRPIDIGLAAAYFCLQAADEGLGTCIIGWFNARRIGKALGIPRAGRAALVIALGEPAPGGEGEKRRKGLDEIRAYNGYSESVTRDSCQAKRCRKLSRFCLVVQGWSRIQGV